MFCSLRQWIISVFFLSSGSLVFAQTLDPVIFNVIINAQNHGEDFFLLSDTGEVLASPETLKSLRFKESLWHGQATDTISLQSLSPDLSFEIDENTVSLTISVPPALLENQEVEIEVPSGLRYDIVSPEPVSGFINYDINYFFTEKGFKSLDVPWEVGLKMGHWLAYSQFRYARPANQAGEHQRLSTHLTWEDPEQLRQLVIGDFTVPRQRLASGGEFGGLSLRTDFSLNPHFVRQPGVDFEAVIDTPSTVELYVNDSLIETRDLQPGEVTFRDIFTQTGSGKAVLVITDAFGTTRRITKPFYVDYDLLKEGLDEYGYHLGFERDFSQPEARYGKLTALGFHRYGFSKTFTGGLHFELNPQISNVGLTATAVFGTSHKIETDLAISYNQGKWGYGVLINYYYKPPSSFEAQLKIKAFSRDYANLSTQADDDKVRKHLTLRLTWNSQKWGRLSLSYSDIRRWLKTHLNSKRLSLSYQNTFKDIFLWLRANRTVDTSVHDEMVADLSYQLADNRRLEYSFRHTDGENQHVVNLLTQEDGENYQSTQFLEHQADGSTQLDKYLQYKGDYGTYTTSYRQTGDTYSGYLSLAGGLGLLRQGVYFTRPIYDSFALVQTGLANVPIFLNHNRVGKTNMAGELLVPDLMAYAKNILSINPSDLPADYNVDKSTQLVQGRRRSGSVVTFDISKFSAVEGYLYLKTPTGELPIEQLPFEVRVNDKKIASFLGKDGYFYLENIPIGQYEATAILEKGICVVTLNIPESDAVLTDLGKLICNRK
jgi:outer membrane usher protein